MRYLMNYMMARTSHPRTVYFPSTRTPRLRFLRRMVMAGLRLRVGVYLIAPPRSCILLYKSYTDGSVDFAL